MKLILLKINKLKDFFKINFILLLLLSSCNKEKPDAAYSNSNFYTLIHDEIERGYYLFIPDSYNNDTKLPLLLNFHGFGGTAYSYINKVDFRSLANSENFILVYAQAISMAKNDGLDLIEISPNAKPPVCKIMDMGKYKYDAQKKANKAKKKQKKIDLKEIKLRPVTELHDYTFKIKNAQKFL